MGQRTKDVTNKTRAVLKALEIGLEEPVEEGGPIGFTDLWECPDERQIWAEGRDCPLGMERRDLAVLACDLALQEVLNGERDRKAFSQKLDTFLITAVDNNLGWRNMLPYQNGIRALEPSIQFAMQNIARALLERLAYADPKDGLSGAVDWVINLK